MERTFSRGHASGEFLGSGEALPDFEMRLLIVMRILGVGFSGSAVPLRYLW